LSAILLHVFSSRLAQLNGETTGAILLVVPALLFGYLARPGEHAIATRLLAGVRVLGLVSALAALGGAGLIASGDIQSTPIPIQDRLDCRLSAGVGGSAAAASRGARDFTCALAGVPASKTPVTKGAQAFMDWLVRLSAGAAVVLVLGVAVNAVGTNRARRRTDQTNPVT
jgi:hypothetical protein